MLSRPHATAGSAPSGDAFVDLFEAHHDRAVRLAYLLVGDHHLAEDIVSDAFAKVFVQWRRGRVNDPAAYLRRAVVNTANSRLRRRYLERGEARRRSGDRRGVRRVDDRAADRDEMWQALLQLPDRQRAAVVLRYYEDLSEADTAAALGVSKGTVKSQVSRGLDRLERLVGAPEDSTSPREGKP